MDGFEQGNVNDYVTGCTCAAREATSKRLAGVWARGVGEIVVLSHIQDMPYQNEETLLRKHCSLRAQMEKYLPRNAESKSFWRNSGTVFASRRMLLAAQTEKHFIYRY